MPTGRGRRRHWQLQKRRSNSRALCVAIAIGSAALATSCMDVAEPTPVATFVRIEPRTPNTYGIESETLSAFHMEFVTRNSGTRRIYLDLGYYRLDKLVDQKWVLAYERSATPFQSVEGINPSAQTFHSTNAISSRGPDPEWP